MSKNEPIGAVAAHSALSSAVRRGAAGLVLLDRDGTLIRHIPYLRDPDQVELLPGVAEGLERLQDAGMTLAIVSNQQAIGLGYHSVQDFVAVNERLFRDLSKSRVRISRVYFCPHTAAAGCECRKPQPGMILRAMREFRTGPERTFFFGDMESDMRAGEQAPCQTVYVGERAGVPATYRARDFLDGVQWVLETAGLKPSIG